MKQPQVGAAVYILGRYPGAARSIGYIETVHREPSGFIYRLVDASGAPIFNRNLRSFYEWQV